MMLSDLMVKKKVYENTHFWQMTGMRNTKSCNTFSNQNVSHFRFQHYNIYITEQCKAYFYYSCYSSVHKQSVDIYSFCPKLSSTHLGPNIWMLSEIIRSQHTMMPPHNSLHFTGEHLRIISDSPLTTLFFKATLDTV